MKNETVQRKEEGIAGTWDRVGAKAGNRKPGGQHRGLLGTWNPRVQCVPGSDRNEARETGWPALWMPCLESPKSSLDFLRAWQLERRGEI